MYAQKFSVEVLIRGERKACPLDWLDQFCMRNFTNSADFDDTLPVADGRIEASYRLTPERGIQRVTVVAPISAKHQNHSAVRFRRSRQRFRNLRFGVRILRINHAPLGWRRQSLFRLPASERRAERPRCQAQYRRS